MKHLIMLLATLAAGAATPSYHVAASVAGPSGSYDYVSVDAALGRVFIGRSFGVEAYDIATRRFRTLLARRGVAAVLPIGERLMLSTNGDQNNATLFDRRTGRVVAEIATGEEPDGAWYDAASGLTFVMNGGSEDVTVIDVAHAKPVARIPVGGVPEGAIGDGKGNLFVNIEDANATAVIDVAARRVVRRHALPGCAEPTGISHDPATGLLIVACRNAFAKLIDVATGADRGGFAIGSRADGSLFDPVRRLGFVPALDGTLTVFCLDAGGRATVLQRLKTHVGARTAAYDSRRNAVYLPAATVERDAAGKYLRAERDFKLLTVARR